MSDSDDEYGPLAATWGSQASETKTNDWSSLLDPNIKIKPNEIGSGNLHRQGRNFKPVDEKVILEQRKGVQIPKKKMQQAIKQTEQSLGLPESRKTNKKRPPVKTKRIEPNQNNASSNWLNSDLVDTPFWEKKSSKNPSVENKTKNLTNDNNWNSYDNTKNLTNSNGWNSYDNIKNSANGNNWNSYDNTKNLANDNNWNSCDNTKNLANDNNQNPSISNSWGTEDSKTKSDSNWKEYDKKNTGSSNGWAQVIQENASNHGWGDTNKEEKSWNQTNKIEVVTNGWENNTRKQPDDSKANGWTAKNHHAVSDKPSWLNSLTSNNQQDSTGGRFSIRNKPLYSETHIIDVPEPVNYRRDGKAPPIPTETAPPPPPPNRHLVTINVQLSATSTISVNIRELDEPSQLAQEFAQNNNISSEKVIEAITKLFTSQKEEAMIIREKKLQRRNPRTPNVNRNMPDYSTYASSPAYRPSSNMSTATTSTFSRRR